MKSICELKNLYTILYSFEKKFQEENGITINEAMVVCCLKDCDYKAAGDICQYLGLSSSRVSKVIAAVERKNYIVRTINEKDKRQMFFSLTEAGRKKMEETMKSNISVEDLYKELQQLISL